MAQQNLDLGTVADDGTGTPLRPAMQIVQDNFDELYLASRSFVTSSGPVTDGSGNVYYGGLVGENWQVNRFDDAFTKTVATIANNAGTPDLATAWTNRESLTYA